MHPRTTLLIAIALAASVPFAHAEPALARQAPSPAHASTVSQVGLAMHEATDHARELVRNALQSLGVPYRRGGDSAETGFDCSGFVRTTFEQALGLTLPRRAAEQAAATRKIGKDDLRPGDLVFFNTLRRAYSHVGIYLGQGRFIHAPRSGATVRIESMDTRYWRARFNGARRALHTDRPAMQATAAAGDAGLRATPALLPADAALAPAAAPLQPASLFVASGDL